MNEPPHTSLAPAGAWNAPTTLIDLSTGLALPWTILGIQRLPNPPSFGPTPTRVELRLADLEGWPIAGYLKHGKYRLSLGEETYAIESSMDNHDPGGFVATVILREYVKPIITTILPKAKNRIRYHRETDARFVVRDNHGPVLGYIVRDRFGYTIEGTFYHAKTMREILANFREVPAHIKAQRLADEIKRDGVLSGLIENLCNGVVRK